MHCGKMARVDADFSRLPTGTAGWCMLIDHALSLGDLSEVDWLEIKGALPFKSKTERKRSAVVIARAVLGLANRMPEAALKHLGGYGVVLVGLDGPAVVGAEETDGAVLHDALIPYVGDDGPRWDHQYVNHPDGLVMAVVVDPPSWGDRIHACRKEYSDEADDATRKGSLSVRDGDVFKRAPGKTRPATSHDLAELERRRDGSPSRGAQVAVEYDGGFDRVASESVKGMFAEKVEKVAASLLKTGPGIPSGQYRNIIGDLMSGQDFRSPTEFRRDVEEWRQGSLGLMDHVSTEFLRHELARGRLIIRNTSDRYLESVRAQVQFQPGVSVLMKSDTDYCHHGGSFNPSGLLPKEPLKWGNISRYGALGINQRIDSISPVGALTNGFEVEESDEGFLVTWLIGDLPPQSRQVGRELFAVVTDEHLTEVVVHWTVTARGIDHVFEGQGAMHCAQEPGEHLHWKRTIAEDGDV